MGYVPAICSANYRWGNRLILATLAKNLELAAITFSLFSQQAMQGFKGVTLYIEKVVVTNVFDGVGFTEQIGRAHV